MADERMLNEQPSINKDYHYFYYYFILSKTSFNISSYLHVSVCKARVLFFRSGFVFF